jgi:5-carboxymethyl-2-hydroxymuconic-semialdehyde dehydrogenase
MTLVNRVKAACDPRPRPSPETLGLQRHFIDGSFVESVGGQTFVTVNPTTNAVLADVCDGRAADVDAAVAAVRRAFDQGPWPSMPAAERATVLRRVAELIRERTDAFIEGEVADIGMPMAYVTPRPRSAADDRGPACLKL